MYFLFEKEEVCQPCDEGSTEGDVSGPAWTVTACNKNEMALNWRRVKGSRGTNFLSSSVSWAAGHISMSKEQLRGV